MSIHIEVTLKHDNTSIALLRDIWRGVAQLKEQLMSTKQEVLDAVAAEKAEVQAKLDELLARIAELEANGAGGATPEELAEIKAAIENIFTPVSPV